VFSPNCSANSEFRLRFRRPHAQCFGLRCERANRSFNSGTRTANPGFALPFQDSYMQILDSRVLTRRPTVFFSRFHIFHGTNERTPRS
jgi:hypothetical protein